MNNYITLDGKKYKTPGAVWSPTVTRPTTIRYTLLGPVDATFGAANLCDWVGDIEGPITPTDGTWGSITDLRASLAKLMAINLIDHYGISYTIVCQGGYKETSFMNVWDDPSNHINISVRLTKVSQP